VSIAAAAACSAIIGTRDLTLEAGDAGPGSTGADATIPVSDGAPGADTGPTPISDGAPGDGAQPPTDGSSGDATCSTSDLQTDPLNCGTCGHSCLGGQCTAGVCQAFTLVPGQLGAVGLAADSTSLYWTTLTNVTVMKSNKDGTGVTTLASPAGTIPFDIAIDNTYVYWSDNEGGYGSVNRVPKTGGDGGATNITPLSLNEAFGVAVDNSHVYWAEYENNAIGRMGLDGGDFGYLVTQLYGGFEVALDDASVYFTTNQTTQKTPKLGPVVSDPINDTTDAAALTTFYSTASVTQPYGVTIDATNVYWTVQGAGLVQYAPRSGVVGSPTSLSSSENGPIMITTDATNVYWTATGPNTGPSNGNDLFLSGYVAMCPKTGCPATGPVMLATGLHNPYGIAVDDTAIYFTIDGNAPAGDTSPNEGSVMKIAK
jgi:hypothetical protein